MGEQRRSQRQGLVNRLPRMRFEKWQALGNDYLIVEAEGLPWALTRGAGPAALRSAFRHRRRWGAAALAQRRSGFRRCAADLQPRRLRGRALGKRRPRGDPLPAPQRLDRPRTTFSISTVAGPITPTITSERTCSVAMGRASTTSKDFPSGAARRRRDTRRRRPRVVLPARLDRQPTMRDRGRRRARRTWTSARSGRRSKATSCSPIGPTSPSSRSTAAACGRGSSSVAWGRRSPRAPAPAAPP